MPVVLIFATRVRKNIASNPFGNAGCTLQLPVAGRTPVACAFSSLFAQTCCVIFLSHSAENGKKNHSRSQVTRENARKVATPNAKAAAKPKYEQTGRPEGQTHARAQLGAVKLDLQGGAGRRESAKSRQKDGIALEGAKGLRAKLNAIGRDTDRKKWSGRAIAERKQAKVGDARRILAADPATSLRVAARELGVSRRTAARIRKKDLGETTQDLQRPEHMGKPKENRRQARSELNRKLEGSGI